MQTKTCTKCLETKLIDEFHKSGTNRYRNQCKGCCKQYEEKRKSENRKNNVRKNSSDWLQNIKSDPIKYEEHLENGRLKSKLIKQNTPINKRIWVNLKSRANKHNIEFSITPNDIEVPEYCPVFTWIKLNHNNIVVSDDSPSGDRINNSLGYIKGNIIVTSNRANRLKQDSNQKEREILSEFYKQFN